MRLLFLIIIAAASVGLSQPSFAASAIPQVPSEDIFGFTSPTDIGNAGDTSFANEHDGRLGKRAGRYQALDSKIEFSRTLPGDWWIAGSFFSAYNRVREGNLALDGLLDPVRARPPMWRRAEPR